MTVKNTHLIEILRGVGLNSNEASIYLAILQSGLSSVWDISKTTFIKRPTCYVILDDLTLRGFAFKTNDGKRTLYSVLSPKKLMLKVQHRFERFNQSITELNALASKSPEKPQTRTYEGVEGLMQVYNLSLVLNKNQEILTYGTAQLARKLTQLAPSYIADRVKQGIHIRTILANTVDDQAIIDRDRKELRETRFLSREQFNPNLEVNIFGNTIAYIVHSEKEPFITVIENSALADFERQKFELLWSLTEK